MSEFQLTRDGLEARDVESDRASMEQRIEAYRHLFPSSDLALLIDENANRSQSTEPSIPEAKAGELSVDVLRAAILDRGALLVRNMFSGAEIDTLTSAIDKTMDICALPRKERKKHACTYYNPPGNLASIMPDSNIELGSLRRFNSISGGAMCVEAPSVAEALLQLYEAHGIKELLSGYFGETPCLSAKKWMLRRTMLPLEEAGWHQDGAFMGTDINSLNLWIPLTECGGDTGAPGMDLVPQRLYKIASSEGATFDWSVSDAHVRSDAFDSSPVAPVFNAGDAFFFDHLYLHRTQFREDISKVRYAVEAWFFGSTSFPKSQIPIAW